MEKTKLMKPTDKAIFGMVSKSAGRNESEPTGGLVKLEPRRPSPQHEGEGSMDWRRLTDAPAHSGGVLEHFQKESRQIPGLLRFEPILSHFKCGSCHS